MTTGQTFPCVGSATGLATGLIVLTLATGCSPVESIGNPSDEPVAEAEGPLGEAEIASDSEAPVVPEEIAPPEPSLVVPGGTEMTFRLAQSLTTESSRAGDPFYATLVEDVVSPAGDILVPSGARVDGVVEASQESQSADEAAVLQLRVQALMVSGEPREIRATVTQTAIRSETRDSGGETAVKIAAGTAAGALVGGIIGRDQRGALIGAGAGAVAGTAVAMTTDDGHARMDEGSNLTLVLDESLEIW